MWDLREAKYIGSRIFPELLYLLNLPLHAEKRPCFNEIRARDIECHNKRTWMGLESTFPDEPAFDALFVGALPIRIMPHVTHRE